MLHPDCVYETLNEQYYELKNEKHTVYYKLKQIKIKYPYKSNFETHQNCEKFDEIKQIKKEIDTSFSSINSYSRSISS